MNMFRPSAFRTYCVAVVMAAAMLLQPLAGVRRADHDVSYLTEIPLQGINPVKPNIMFTLDDSAV